MWTRAELADHDREPGDDALYRRAAPAPGRRTLTQSLATAQQHTSSDVSPARPDHRDPAEVSDPVAGLSGAAVDPFDFRDHALAGASGRVRASEHGMCSCGSCESCKAGAATVETVDHVARPVQRRATGNHEMRSVEAAVARGLGSAGQALDAQTRTFMESRFGHDFGEVRVHASGAAGESARALHAEAYTVGRDIVFAHGKYDPTSRTGRHLLAHELTHVVQQGGSRAGVPLAQRRAAEGAPDAAPTAAGQPDSQSGNGDTTGKLQQLIARIEQIHARSAILAGDPGDGATGAQATGDATDVHVHRSRVGELLGQLRAVASGDDEVTKQQVLGAFSPTGAQQAERTLESLVRIEQRRPEGMAARSLAVSMPGDPAETEAERVADAVMASGSVTVQQRAAGPHRAVAEAMIAFGVTTLEVDAVTAPETGPPGWVVGGIVALGALAVIGAGYVLMAANGNVADTGIVQEAQALLAAGTAATMCEALQILMDQAEQARDSARKQRIKATQKAKGCRHSRHS